MYLNTLLAVLILFWQWSVNLSLESVNTPRSFSTSVFSNLICEGYHCLCAWSSLLSCWFYQDVTPYISLDGISSALLWTRLRSSWSCFVESSDDRGRWIFVSSANRLMRDWMFSGMSLMNKENKTGPRIEPWGMPLTTGAHDDSYPFTRTFWVLLLKNDLIHPLAFQWCRSYW